MPDEFEVAAAASAAGFFRRASSRQHPPLGALCANCATPLLGPWCQACGQSAEDFHRSIVRLIGEVVEGLLHMDGRLWRTLPDLMLRPGRLTRAYLDGHRAPQIPPLRLLLVVLLMIFLVGGLSGGPRPARVSQTNLNGMNLAVIDPGSTGRTFDQLPTDERAKLRASLDKAQVRIGGPKQSVAATRWLRDRLASTLADPQRFYLILEQWGERFVFLMLPVSALMLSALFIFQRRFYLFDHTIFSLHSLSAMGLVITLALGLSTVVDDWAFIFLLPAPVHLFAHMRGVYRTSVLGTLLRMALLFLGSSIAAGILVVGLIAVGLNGMGE